MLGIIGLATSTACGPLDPVREPDGAVIEWAHYGGDAGGTKYSRASLIDRRNVGQLQIAWTARTGDAWVDIADTSNGDERGRTARGALGSSDRRFETTPIMLNRTLYVSTPFNRVIALDPVTGSTRWTFDPKLDTSRFYPEGFTSRGVSVWRDTTMTTGASCASTVFLATVDARLIALDALRGTPCERFGNSGAVQLAQGAAVGGRDASSFELSVTSPVAILADAVIVGSAVRKRGGDSAASGAVRAFDARTGALRWSFDPIPRQPSDRAWSAWRPEDATSALGANVWSVISVDAERDLVFLPTASAVPNFYGGMRAGRNDHANSIVAIQGSTGALHWSFQLVHHDLWDYDVAAQPVLATIRRAGQDVPAVIAGTKSGMIFVLHRETGVPLIPVVERPVPPSDVPGEQAWRT